MPNRPDIPWRFPVRRETEDRIEYKLFENDRKGGPFEGGGSVEVEVYLGGTWHAMKFITSGAGYRALAALPEPSRSLLLDALAMVPIRGNLLATTGRKRARGRSKRDAGFWHNVDYWAPGLLAWTVDALKQTKKPAQLRRVIAAATTAGLRSVSPDEIAAAICVLTWSAISRVNAERFPMPIGKSLHGRVTARISAKLKHEIPWTRPSKEFIDAVLNPGEQAQRLRHHVVVLAPPEEFGPSVPMTDFRI